MDFAVTSGMSSADLHRSAIDHTAAIVDYEAYKRNYLSTTTLCEQQGLQFLPIVAEGHGGSWGYANHNGIDTSTACSEFAQRMSITLERENARAILRRLSSGGSHEAGCTSAAWLDDDMEDPSGDVLMSFQ